MTGRPGPSRPAARLWSVRVDRWLAGIGGVIMLAEALVLSYLAIAFGFITVACRWNACNATLTDIGRVGGVLAPPLLAAASIAVMTVCAVRGNRVGWIPFIVVPGEALLWTLALQLVRAGVD